MRPRLTLVALLALGIAVAATGTALAAPDYGTDASEAQYPPISGPPGLVDRPEPPAEPPGPTNEPNRPSDELPEEALFPPPTIVEQVEQVEQVETGADALAFTGFAAIPVLLLGVALVTTGLALRRRGPGRD